jgi:hypothetical protein
MLVCAMYVAGSYLVASDDSAKTMEWLCVILVRAMYVCVDGSVAARSDGSVAGVGQSWDFGRRSRQTWQARRSKQ